MTKISQLTALGSALESNDQLFVRDISDASVPVKSVTPENITDTLVKTGDIGTAPNQIPLNQHLGTMAFQSAASINVGQIGADGSLPVLVDRTERLRIDSSGRVLVGTSTSANTGDAQYGTLQVKGNTFNSNNHGIVVLSRGESATSITAGEELGQIEFADTSGNPFGRITCIADASAGSSDYPGRLVFSTTADGASSPTERMRITSTGQLRLAGAGITFNGDTATANELDDYEEGTWTPVVTAGSGSFTTVTTSGRYVKIGKTVLLGGQVNITDAGTAAGSINITNPPFNAAANDTFCGSVARRDQTLQPGGYAKFQSSSAFNIVRYDGVSFIANGNQLIFTIFYEAS